MCQFGLRIIIYGRMEMDVILLQGKLEMENQTDLIKANL